MEFTSSSKRERVINIFQQIENATKQLKEWNANIETADDYYMSPEGMQKLAASCMLIEAIGEGIRQIDVMTDGKLLIESPEIPWEDVTGIRNHIAHGYFDIDGEVVLVSSSKILTYCRMLLVIFSTYCFHKV
ncbi:MAG: DUF86 domain-containing protein [Bacteroidales bacterium]|nr:DUF86 domain-containing protein [Bacteroidales bacterium]